MALLVHVDESGCANLEGLDPRKPIFVVSMAISKQAVYTDDIVPAWSSWKESHCGGSHVILRSYDIRNQKGSFGFLAHKETWDKFSLSLIEQLHESPFSVLATAINIPKLIQRYGDRAHDPYHLGLKFCMERLLFIADQEGETDIHLVAEMNNKNVDRAIRDAFRAVLQGTEFKDVLKFSRYNFTLDFVPKSANVLGTQLADLCAYPIGLHVEGKKYRPWPVIESKLYRGPEWLYKYGKPPGWSYGLKVFPQ